jgi:hydrogenase maturation factor
VCARFGIDPWGAIASGSLLLAVDPADAGAVVAAVEAAGIEACVIGGVVRREQGVSESSGGARRPLRSYPRDEIVKAFG